MDSEQPIRWEDLVKRIQQSDSAAEEELGTYFHPRVVALAIVRLRDAEAAREIAQDTLLAVLQAVRDSKVREPEKLPGFVYGTARNLVNNHLRSRAQNPDPDPLPPDIVAPPLTPATEESEQRRIVIRIVVKQLKPVDRQILLYTLVEGRNPREIAPLVGLSPEVVRTRKARAIKIVMKEVEKLKRKQPGSHSVR